MSTHSNECSGNTPVTHPPRGTRPILQSRHRNPRTTIRFGPFTRGTGFLKKTFCLLLHRGSKDNTQYALLLRVKGPCLHPCLLVMAMMSASDMFYYSYSCSYIYLYGVFCFVFLDGYRRIRASWFWAYRG